MRSLVLALLAIALLAPWAFAQDESDEPRGKANFPPSADGFGPTSVPYDLAEADEFKEPLIRFAAFDRALKPWFDFKGRLSTRHGFQFGADWHGLYQHIDGAPVEDEALSGIFRVFGEWKLLNRCKPLCTGSLIWKVEYRDTIGTDVAPGSIGFVNGYAGIPGTLFSDFGWALTNLYWKQKFANGRGTFIVGQLDATDYLDVIGIANPFTMFSNLSVLVNPAMVLPNQGLGAAASWRFQNNSYVIVGVNDANALPTRDGFQTFEEGETFKFVEYGFACPGVRHFLDNIHLTVWHQDRLEKLGVPEAWGWSLSGTRSFQDDQLVGAFRVGWSSDAAPISERHFSTMWAYRVRKRGDVVGFGAAWDRVWGQAQGNQLSTELFWRLVIAENIQLTPSVQWLRNPAFAPTEKDYWAFGLRFRLTL